MGMQAKFFDLLFEECYIHNETNADSMYKIINEKRSKLKIGDHNLRQLLIVSHSDCVTVQDRIHHFYKN